MICGDRYYNQGHCHGNKEIPLNSNNVCSQFFKKQLKKTGKGIASMSDQEKKDFFNKVDKEYKAKAESDEKMKVKSKETMTGKEKTPVDTEPKINYNK